MEIQISNFEFFGVLNMLKNTNKYIVSVSIVIVSIWILVRLFAFILILFINNSDNKNIKTYNDVSLYIDSEYNQLSDDRSYKATADICANY